MSRPRTRTAVPPRHGGTVPLMFGPGPGQEAARNLYYRNLLLALAGRLGDFHEPGRHPPVDLLREIVDAVDGARNLPGTPNQEQMYKGAIVRAREDFQGLDIVHRPWKELSRLLRAMSNCVAERSDATSAYNFERATWLAESLLAIWTRIPGEGSRPAA
jgi:hypothetical protein